MALSISINFLQDLNGEPGDLIENNQLLEGQTFFVEILVQDDRDLDAVGLIGLALDIQWNPQIFISLNTPFIPSNVLSIDFPFFPEGILDNDLGLIDDLGAGALPAVGFGAPLGKNGPERFALLHFKTETGTDATTPFAVSVSNPGKVAFADGAVFDPTTVAIEAEGVEVVANDVVYEIFSKEMIFIPFDQLQANGAEILDRTGYVIDQVFNDSTTDLQALGLRNIDPNLPPVLVFRGTESDLDNLEGTNPNGIGETQFEGNRDAIEAWLIAIAKDTDKNPNGLLPSVTGQSLGGSLAQFTIAAFPTLIDEAVTFGSPSVPRSIADAFTENGGTTDQVTHHVVSGDFVSLAGRGVFIPGTVFLYTYTTPEFDPENIYAKHDTLVLSNAPAGTTFAEIPLDQFNAPDFAFQDTDYQEFLTALEALDPDLANHLKTRAGGTILNQTTTIFELLETLETLFSGTTLPPVVSISADQTQLFESDGTTVTVTFNVVGQIPANGLPVLINANTQGLENEFAEIDPNDLTNLDIELAGDGNGFIVTLLDNQASLKLKVLDDGLIEGDESFTLTIADNDNLTPNPDATSISFSIADKPIPVNQAPSAQNDSVSLAEDTSTTINVAANDTDIDGNLDPSSVMKTSDPLHGTLSNNGDGTIQYTPNPNFNGFDSFTYQIADLEGLTSTATVNISVTPANDPPVGRNDSYSIPYNSPLSVNADAGVLANDTDLDGDSLTVNLIQDVNHGTLAFKTDGSFTYTPNATFTGDDSFTYQANDGNTDSEIVTVTLSVGSIETIAPNNGDGNQDNIPDAEQAYVESRLQLDNNNSTEDIFTLSGPPTIDLSDLQVTDNPAPDAPGAPSSFGTEFPIGYLSFNVTGFTGDAVTLRLQLPNEDNQNAESIDTYWKYGATPDNPEEHWYEFLYDGTTGAEFVDNDNNGITDEVILHFVDGQRGDGDLSVNGVIVDPGAPGISNNAPIIQAQSFTVKAKAPVNTQVGTVIVTDDPGDSLTLAIVGGNTDFDGDSILPFSITNAGVITVSDSDDLNANLTSRFDLSLLATDQAGVSSTENIVINLLKDASSVGDPHFTTFDGHYYHFQGVGEFLLTQSLTSDLEVQVQQTPWRPNPKASVNTAVATKVDGHLVAIKVEPEFTVTIDNTLNTINVGEMVALGQGSITRTSSNVYVIEYESGEELRTTIGGSAEKGHYLNPYLSLLANHEIMGLLGNNDGNPENDLMLRDGTQLSLNTHVPATGVYADSWQVAPEDSFFTLFSSGDALTDSPNRPDREARVYVLEPGFEDFEIIDFQHDYDKIDITSLNLGISDLDSNHDKLIDASDKLVSATEQNLVLDFQNAAGGRVSILGEQAIFYADFWAG